MPHYLLQPDPTKDEYVLWSTVVDNAISPVLSREGMAEHLLQAAIREAKREIERTLNTADHLDPGDPILVTNVDHDDFDGFYFLKNNDVVGLVRAQEAGDVDALSELLSRAGDEA